MAPKLVQMEKVSMRDRVGRALRAAIISGEMEPGVVYSAPSLGSRFGVSATPVREAMLDLVREELVEIVPNKGFRVTEISETDLDQITEIRLLIEPPAVSKVTPIIPDDDFAELRELAQNIVTAAEAGDLVEYTEADRVFHLRLLSYADNPRMTNLVSDLRAHTRLFGLAALRERGELVDVAQEHHTIVDALQARDQTAAESQMRAHISQVRGRWASPGPDSAD
ncbi:MULTISPECIES: GntR family transcriptional regulator [Prauserella salsuginis group]|uniref:DNA-binding GntR family transcriptional regulator n=2 Tax=Prauserella salsuginis group TaxID=2893672 RepID=A0A839XUD9_9PSEU|nr:MULTISPECIES: GntR family transcriptional regulator [Prauserella salsuginis group]MBB3663626.1 DNA-binding GntR family transcriptional regulator [Prauserella sediminis]MCR3722592.1 DNA-binding transcriptional regulator, GntR family [Prauserella flava]MCR3737034.1 DNA-binding transcriptional regulator, GntR family [Prauserella salsuginis]